MAVALRNMHCTMLWLRLGLAAWLLVAGAGGASYKPDELLTWLQHSNFGYMVLQQALNSSLVNDAGESEVMCLAQVRLLLQLADNQALPAVKVVDAWGKFPSGLLYGHFVDMGNYESCLSVGGSGSILPASKYCLTHIPFESLQPLAQSLTVRIGACLPAACSAAQLNSWLRDYLQTIFEGSAEPSQALLVQERDCAIAQREPMSALDWFAVAVLVLLGCLVLLSSLLDYTKAPPSALLSVFSLRHNLRQLLHTRPAKSSPHVVDCLHGIRCLTIIWIILGHGYMFLLLSPLINASEIVAWAQSPYSMLMQSGTTSVDTFFLIGGMLLVMVTLRELERNSGKLNVPLLYLHRLVRLTPVLALAVLLFVTLFPRLDSGPLWQDFTSSYQLCESTWWATLLYVQNYAAAGRMCLGHSWYLAVDMQLFILSPLFLLSLWHWRRKAVAGIVSLILLLFGCVFSIIMLNELLVFNPDGNLSGDSKEMRKIYYTTHARATPWLIGLLFGYFMHSERGRRRRLSKWLVLILWLLALALIATVIFAVYPYTQPGAGLMSPLAGAFYLCCSRIAWPLALCWLIWACQNGYAGFINKLLSWSFWQPVSKLSYCMYIWHLLVETAHAGRSKTELHFSNYDTILRFWSDFGITMIVSLLMYLCVETPLVRLEMHLLKSHQNPTPKPATPPVALEPTTIMASQITLVEA